MAGVQTKPLDADTWTDFARLVEANNGVRGGCWCMWYHRKDTGEAPAEKSKMKELLACKGRDHASLVFEEEICVGWCRFGTPQELQRIHNQRAYLATKPGLPDWRITCFFVGKGFRGKGVAKAALKGAIDQIKLLGGGRIEGYPEDTEGRKATPAFLINGPLSLFEDAGFSRSREIKKYKGRSHERQNRPLARKRIEIVSTATGPFLTRELSMRDIDD